MTDDFTHNLLLDYLATNYPIVRMKDKNGFRFQRAVLIDGGEVLFMNNHQDFQRAVLHILRALYKVFRFEDEETKKAVSEYYNLD